MTDDQIKDAMPDKDVDMDKPIDLTQSVEPDGDPAPTRTPAETLPEGWTWVDYHDGSGHLESPDKSFELSYDRGVRYGGEPAIDYRSSGSEQFEPFFGTFSEFREWAEGEALRLINEPQHEVSLEKEIDLSKVLPPVRTAAAALPEGWTWVDNHDGSGCLESPDRSFEISFDRNVRYFGDPVIEYHISGTDRHKPFFGSFTKFKEWAEGEAQRLMTEPQHTPEHDRSAELDKEKMTVLIVEPMQEPRVATIDSGLESLQEAVGGYIEAVYPFEDPVALVCNEEGKLDGLPLNRGLYDAQGHLYDIVSGTFLVVGLSEESFGSLTPEQIEKYTAMYRTPQTFAIVNGTLLALPVKETAEIEAQRRTNERLDAVKFDNDIDLDKEKTRAQLGFRDQDPKPAVKSARFPMKERLEKAVSEAAHRASEAVKQKVTDRKMEVKDRC